jgi:hypothetical protein
MYNYYMLIQKIMFVDQRPTTDLGTPDFLLVASPFETWLSSLIISLWLVKSSGHLACQMVRMWEVAVGSATFSTPTSTFWIWAQIHVMVPWGMDLFFRASFVSGSFPLKPQVCRIVMPLPNHNDMFWELCHLPILSSYHTKLVYQT